jgi:hypothetical protein
MEVKVDVVVKVAIGVDGPLSPPLPEFGGVLVAGGENANAGIAPEGIDVAGAQKVAPAPWDETGIPDRGIGIDMAIGICICMCICMGRGIPVDMFIGIDIGICICIDRGIESGIGIARLLLVLVLLLLLDKREDED